MNITRLLVALVLLVTPVGVAGAAHADWKHSASIYLLTTPEGAAMDAGASVKEFPALIRLHQDFFDFTQARTNGEDIRFATATGDPLAYQIDEWDAARGTASIWVRIPLIKGNQRQEIRLHWGKADAVSESRGAAVFNESNGYLSVWHMNGVVKDEVGTLESKDVGTTPSAGVIGAARRFAGKQGIFGGDKIANYPSGAASHTTQVWMKAERVNGTIIGWGNEPGGRGTKVRMQFRSPPHVKVDSNFSDVKGERTLPMGEWVQVAHTYERGAGKIYINGTLDGSAAPMLKIQSPARLWIGGWYNSYDFVGDLDEVRVSKVARSAEWVKLEYENQKPMQRLTGLVVQAGDAFSVSPAAVKVNEGQKVMVRAQAGGAQKIDWMLKRDGKETLLTVDRLNFEFEAGRVSGDQSATLVLRAVYPNEVKTREIPVTIKEAVADPVFSLKAPAAWDGRSTIEVRAEVANLDAIRDAGPLSYSWNVADLAVTKQIAPGKLILTRAQNSGTIAVTATLHNSGQRVSQRVELVVKEPARDAWAARVPEKDEKPEENQFYPRDDRNEGTLYYNGTLAENADTVFLKVYADGAIYKQETSKPGADKAYAFAVKLKPGLVKYKVEFGSKSGGLETVLHTVNNLVCGDAYLINGQSNAVATAWGKEEYTFGSPWIRTYGSMESGMQGARLKGWGEAAARGKDGRMQVGYWAMELARRLVEGQKMPICILNGAVGGTRIDQHQRNAADAEEVTGIYGRLLWRVRQAKLTHGIRGVLWHQGENDQGADGPTGGFGWETYRALFIEMASAWKQDYPNIQHYYVFQIWPKSCAMGINGSDNRLREVQRMLPTAFSRMSVMSTLGIDPPGGCHYPPAGYAEMARVIAPLIERDHYGKAPVASITAPNLQRTFYTDGKKDHIAMEFDQPVNWDDSLAGQFHLDGEKGMFTSGSVAGNVVTLRLSGPSAAKTLTYLDSKAWSQATLLRGVNGIAALTFCEVAIEGR